MFCLVRQVAALGGGAKSTVSDCIAYMLTSRFDGFVVGFTDELFIVHEVELVAGVELATAHGTGEAFEVVDVILSSSDDLCRRNSLFTPGTLRAVTTAIGHVTTYGIFKSAPKGTGPLFSISRSQRIRVSGG